MKIYKSFMSRIHGGSPKGEPEASIPSSLPDNIANRKMAELQAKAKKQGSINSNSSDSQIEYAKSGLENLLPATKKRLGGVWHKVDESATAKTALLTAVGFAGVVKDMSVDLSPDHYGISGTPVGTGVAALPILAAGLDLLVDSELVKAERDGRKGAARAWGGAKTALDVTEFGYGLFSLGAAIYLMPPVRGLIAQYAPEATASIDAVVIPMYGNNCVLPALNAWAFLHASRFGPSENPNLIDKGMDKIGKAASKVGHAMTHNRAAEAIPFALAIGMSVYAENYALAGGLAAAYVGGELLLEAALMKSATNESLFNIDTDTKKIVAKVLDGGVSAAEYLGAGVSALVAVYYAISTLNGNPAGPELAQIQSNLPGWIQSVFTQVDPALPAVVAAALGTAAVYGNE